MLGPSAYPAYLARGQVIKIIGPKPECLVPGGQRVKIVRAQKLFAFRCRAASNHIDFGCAYFFTDVHVKNDTISCERCCNFLEHIFLQTRANIFFTDGFTDARIFYRLREKLYRRPIFTDAASEFMSMLSAILAARKKYRRHKVHACISSYFQNF